MLILKAFFRNEEELERDVSEGVKTVNILNCSMKEENLLDL